jgi:hypothetical protein
MGRVAAVALGVLAAGSLCTGSSGKSATRDLEPGRSLVCKLPAEARKLPASARRGLVGHLLQYPVVALASPAERAQARRLLATLRSAAERGWWRDLDAAVRAGFRMRTAVRKPGDRSIHYFHAERRGEQRGRGPLDPRRPKALIFANAPGHPLRLVGAMWSTRDGERGPNPGGPITRWHSHVVCKAGKKRGLKPPASGRCPRGSRLTQGASEMLHVWFTHDLRSAFAIRAPEPELCESSLLPRSFCSFPDTARS